MGESQSAIDRISIYPGGSIAASLCIAWAFPVPYFGITPSAVGWRLACAG
jgi:hypothetical protein